MILKEGKNKNMDKENNIIYIEIEDGIFKCYNEASTNVLYRLVEPTNRRAYITSNEIIKVLTTDDLYEQVKKQKEMIDNARNFINGIDLYSHEYALDSIELNELLDILS